MSDLIERLLDRVDVAEKRIADLEAALMEITLQSDDCYSSDLWKIHGIAEKALKEAT